MLLLFIGINIKSLMEIVLRNAYAGVAGYTRYSVISRRTKVCQSPRASDNIINHNDFVIINMSFIIL